MNEHRYEELMQSALAFGKNKNPIWPFAALIVDQWENILVSATDCAHISPLYHAESLAIHLLISKLGVKPHSSLTLITTAEPDAMSMSCIHWANVVHEAGIRTVVHGCPLQKIERIWPFGIKITAAEIVQKSSGSQVDLIGPILESETHQLFLEAKERQNMINKAHPASGNIPGQLKAFYELNL